MPGLGLPASGTHLSAAEQLQAPRLLPAFPGPAGRRSEPCNRRRHQTTSSPPTEKLTTDEVRIPLWVSQGTTYNHGLDLGNDDATGNWLYGRETVETWQGLREVDVLKRVDAQAAGIASEDLLRARRAGVIDPHAAARPARLVPARDEHPRVHLRPGAELGHDLDAGRAQRRLDGCIRASSASGPGDNRRHWHRVVARGTARSVVRVSPCSPHQIRARCGSIARRDCQRRKGRNNDEEARSAADA
jgi:hypothetical protein